MLKELTLAFMLNISTHVLGHFQEANNYNIDMHLDLPTMTEFYPCDNNKYKLLITGASFRAQDSLVRFTEGKEIHKYNLLANSIYKIGYLLGARNIWSSKRGDIEHIEEFSGNKNIRTILLIVAISDYYKFKNSDSKYFISFWQAQSGAPGLIVSSSF